MPQIQQPNLWGFSYSPVLPPLIVLAEKITKLQANITIFLTKKTNGDLNKVSTKSIAIQNHDIPSHITNKHELPVSF